MNLFLSILVGAIAGVVINYFADVLPIRRRFTRPICLNCAKPYSWRDYFFSFRCKNCGQKTSIRVILVILLSMAACIALIYFPLGNLGFWATVPILVFLGTILVIDIEYRIVLKETSYFGLAFMLLYGILLHGLLPTIFGGAAGFAIMMGLYFLGILFNKVAGKIRKQEIDEVALGFGDVYVTTFLGFFAGWPNIIAVLLLAILASGIFSLLYILVKIIARRYHTFSAIPYTPFLILAAISIFYLL